MNKKNPEIIDLLVHDNINGKQIKSLQSDLLQIYNCHVNALSYKTTQLSMSYNPIFYFGSGQYPHIFEFYTLYQNDNKEYSVTELKNIRKMYLSVDKDSQSMASTILYSMNQQKYLLFRCDCYRKKPLARVGGELRFDDNYRLAQSIENYFKLRIEQNEIFNYDNIVRKHSSNVLGTSNDSVVPN